MTGNLEKAYQTLESCGFRPSLGAGMNPTFAGLVCAGLSTNGTGRFERIIEAAQKANRGSARRHLRGTAVLSSGYYFLDRFDEAERTLQQADERKFDEP